MDRHHRRNRGLLISLVTWIVTFVLLAPAGGALAQPGDLGAWATAFPVALEHDLAAMVLPPDAYPGERLAVGRGHLFRPAEEAAAHLPFLGLSEEDLLARMRDAGWIARYVSEVGPAESPAANTVATIGWSSITAYADASGALDGFALLDESAAEGVDVELIPARQIGEGARLTRYRGTDADGRAFERLRYTFVSGPLVGSVAVFRGDDTPDAAMTPEAMVTMGERLLERMEAAEGMQGLPSLVLRLNPAEALPIAVHDEGYFSVDGRTMPHQGDSAEAIAAANRFNELYGVEASYIAHTTFAWQEGVLHRPTWLVALYTVEGPGAAADLVGQHARYDRSVGYDELVELDELPELDGPVAGSAYTEAWADGSLSEGYRITVAVGSTVAIVDISAPGGVDERDAFALVEAQVACLKLGMCAPLPAPFLPVTVPATPGT